MTTDPAMHERALILAWLQDPAKGVWFVVGPSLAQYEPIVWAMIKLIAAAIQRGEHKDQNDG